MWPSAVPENLAFRNVENPHVRAPYELAFDETLAEIQQHVEQERANNVNTVAFLSTNYKNGMTIIPAPRGIIRRVYTLANGNEGDPVFYTQVRWPEPEAWGRNTLTQLTTPANTGVIPALALGFRRAEATTDRDGRGNLVGRARSGVWAIYDENVWIAPWLQSNETLRLEWRGKKDSWTDDDLVTSDQDYVKCVFLYMRYIHERDYGDKQIAMTIHQRLPDGRFIGTFDEALADLITERDRQTRVNKADPQSSSERSRLAPELADDVVP